MEFPYSPQASVLANFCVCLELLWTISEALVGTAGLGAVRSVVFLDFEHFEYFVYVFEIFEMSGSPFGANPGTAGVCVQPRDGFPMQPGDNMIPCTARGQEDPV